MLKKEDSEAVAFANWLRCRSYRFTHIANESGLPPKVAMLSAIKKKKMGVSPGVPDFLIILKRGSLLFIELKRTLEATDYRKDGKLLASAPKPSEEQMLWIDALHDIENVSAHVAYGLLEAIRIVEESEKL